MQTGGECGDSQCGNAVVEDAAADLVGAVVESDRSVGVLMKEPVVAAVALKVTVCPATEGLRLEVRVVEVVLMVVGRAIVSGMATLQLLTKF